jgi:DNA-binding HxlR family transcriptional regulator
MADKRSIAQLLSEDAGRWNSPAEIKAEIADVPDRTLRRWLGELVHEGVIERSGSRKGTRYRWKSAAKEEQRLPAAAAADAGRSTTPAAPSQIWLETASTI